MYSPITTEIRNERTMESDNMTIEEFLSVMNDEDAKVSLAVREQIPQIEKAVIKIIETFRSGGRLIYMGAGTSGRIGLLDAVECPPTFGISSDKILGLIAGGDQAFIKAIEGAEDKKNLGVKDLKNIGLTNKDVVVGLAASGRTPYVIGALEYAKQIGATTVSVSCNKESLIGDISHIAIELSNGPEVLTGSTRLKAGTSQKLVCNMLTTASMIGIGKVYGNLMVDLRPTNNKLFERAKIIIMEATSCDYETASNYLKLAKNKPKVSIIMLLTGLSYEESLEKLEIADGFVRNAIPY